MSSSSNIYAAIWQSLEPIYGREEAIAVTRLLLSDMFGFTLTDLVCGKADALSDHGKATLQEAVCRLQKGEPVQYVLGHAEFFGRSFHVAPGVLIPRPETEGLCRLVLDNSKFKIQKLLDVGTGSGCIAITLAKKLPMADVTAVDISQEALRIAADNAKRLEANVQFMQCDILHPTPLADKHWDIIISNPPYVTEHEKADMAHNVLDYEPPTALFVPDNDPLLFYRAIARYAATALNDGGRLFFEINPLYANDMQKLLLSFGFQQVEIIKDEYGKRRYTMGTKIRD